MKNKKILIIEDEKDIVIFLKEILKGEGYEVFSVENGKEAQALMDNESFDLVILDMLLPGEHGINIVNYIRDHFFTPIIITSGIYSRNEILKGMEDSNIKGFFPKPFNVKDLLKRIYSIFNEEKV